MTTDNYPSWDAKAWLAEFEPSKMVQGGTRPVRAKVFQSTLEIVNKGGYMAPSGIIVRFDNLHNGKTLQDNVFCEKEITLKMWSVNTRPNIRLSIRTVWLMPNIFWTKMVPMTFVY